MRRVLVLIAAAALVALLLWMQSEEPVRMGRTGHEAPTSGDLESASIGSTANESPDAARTFPIDDDPRRIPGPDVVITGRVERNGERVPNATVEARRYDDPIVIAATTTDGSGAFRLTIARRTRLLLSGRDQDGRHTSALLLIPHKGNPDEVVIRLKDAHAFGGIVLNPDGTPHAGAEVRMIPESEWYTHTTETDADGRFALHHVEPGPYEIHIVATGYPVIRRFANVPEMREFKATLFAGGSIRGTLRDDFERPIGGATITLHSGDGRKSPAGIAKAVTNADGSFVMPSVMPGPCWNAVVSHPDWGPRLSNDDDVTLPFERVRAGEELTWDITVPTYATLVVRAVAAESGAPLPGVLISATPVRPLSRSEPTKSRRARTDSRGIVSFPHATRDGNRIQLEHPGRRIRSRDSTSGDVVLQCELTGIVEGRVRGGRSAKLDYHGLRLQHGPSDYEWTGVDCTGRFQFGAVRECANAEIVAHTAHVKSRRFDVIAGERIWVDVDVPHRPAVTGFVVDGDGSPVVGAKVRVVASSRADAVVRQIEKQSWRWDWADTTTAQGEFAIHDPESNDKDEPEGRSGKWSLIVLHPDYRPAQKDGLDKPNSVAPQTITVELREGESITGVVFFATGQPSPNIPVKALPAGTSPREQAPRRVMTDSNGKFTLRGLKAGGWDLKALHGEGISAPVSAQAGARNVRLTIEMHPPITGLLLDDESRPIGGALVVLRRYRRSNLTARTEPNGRFRIEHVPPGRHRLNVKPSQWMSPKGLQGSVRFPEFESEPIAPGTADVVLRAERGEVLSGRILDANGAPVPRATIVAQFHDAWMTIANADGEFSIKVADDDPVTVNATAAGQPIRTMQVTPGSGITEIRLPPGGSIRGRVLDAAGQPKKGVLVRAWAEVGTLGRADRISRALLDALRIPARWTATTAEDGTFTIPNIEAGAYKLDAAGKDGTSAQARVQTDGPSVDLQLTR